MKTIIESAEAPRPYEPISLALTASDINEVMRCYIEFLHLPFHERIRLHHRDPERPRVGTSGYVHKGKESPTGHNDQDNKHSFHMSQQLAGAFRFGLGLPAESRSLLTAAEMACEVVERSVKLKYEELEAEIPGLATMHFPSSGVRRNKLRLLAYQTPKDGMLASPHYDKGTGTVAIAESDSGLRLGFGPEDLAPAEPGPKFFAGFGWHQLAEIMGVTTSHRAAWHDVIDTGQRVNEDISRWAMVYFIDPANLYLHSSTEQTHTPIPWRGLGELALRSDNQSFLLG